MDGFETAELIRSRPRSRQIPILFLTGYRNEEHLFRGYDLGAVDFLFKPIVPEVLRSKVAAFVELSRSNAKLQEQADALRRQAAGAAKSRTEVPLAAGSRARRHGGLPRGRRDRHGQFADRSALQLPARSTDLQEHPLAGAGLGISPPPRLGRRVRQSQGPAGGSRHRTGRLPGGQQPFPGGVQLQPAAYRGRRGGDLLHSRHQRTQESRRAASAN